MISRNKSHVIITIHPSHRKDKLLRMDLKEIKSLLGETEYIHCVLAVACSAGQLDVVKFILDQKVPTSYDALWHACLCPLPVSKEIVQLLLERRTSVDVNEERALRMSCFRGRQDLVELLLDAGANIHVRDDEALRNASKQGHLGVVQLLLDRGANVHAKENDALCLASEGGHLDVVRLLLDRGANVYAKGFSVCTSNGAALRLACAHQHLAVIELLLDRGADVRNVYVDVCSTRKLNVEVLKMLVTRGLNLSNHNWRNYVYATAIEIGNLEIIRLLLVAKADINYLLQNAACSPGKINIVTFLLDEGADADSNDSIALKNACYSGQPDIVKLLLSRGGNAEEIRNYGIFEPEPNQQRALSLARSWNTVQRASTLELIILCQSDTQKSLFDIFSYNLASLTTTETLEKEKLISVYVSGVNLSRQYGYEKYEDVLRRHVDHLYRELCVYFVVDLARMIISYV